MVHRDAIIPLADGINNLEHWTAQRRRVHYSQWCNQRPVLGALSLLHSYNSHDILLTDGTL